MNLHRVMLKIDIKVYTMLLAKALILQFVAHAKAAEPKELQDWGFPMY